MAKQGDIVCWQITLKEVLLKPYSIRTDFCRNYKYYVGRKMTESLTPIAYWRIKSINKPLNP